MKILISGSTGLIGEALTAALRADGVEVVRLARRATPEPHVLWDPAAGTIDKAGLDGFDAVVHLAGKSIAAGRWTRKLKNEILQSRVVGTELLAQSLAGLARPPKAFVCASAIGFYGNRGHDALGETSPAGTGFLPDVCRAWEAAAEPARQKGLRVAHVRFGVVLSERGGALAKMLLPFKLGLGGTLGSGDQFMGWISLEDAVGAVRHVLSTATLEGPLNAVAPQALTNREFTKALGRALHRPTIFPVPGFAARLVLGEMAEALLLASQRVEPRRLLESGYRFRHPDIDAALKALLG
ncbi:MAG: TIGR01777 family protein [Elusimicrobia bacterium]|nr:TIGR01777 family protein [Elusimicrobiota bacterium]